MENLFDVTIVGDSLVKDSHPMTMPVKPELLKKDNAEAIAKYEKALNQYNKDLQEYRDIDLKLNRYNIESIVIESGMIIKASVISFEMNGKRKAKLINPSTVQLVYSKGMKYETVK